MYTRLNNILLALFICTELFELFLNRKPLDLRRFLFNGWPVLCFFCLSILAAFRSIDLQSLKYLENHWSLLLVPIVMLNGSQEYYLRRRQAFLMLLWGSLVTLFICNINFVLEGYDQGFTMKDWLDLDNFGHVFTAVADTHPTYLGLFVFTSTLFLVQDQKFPKALKVLILVFLLLGLLQLTNTIAFLLFTLFLLYVVIYSMKRQNQKSAVSVIGLLVCVVVFIFYGRSFMDGRLFFVDTILDEKRVQRWEVSYEIFRENPLIGVGYAQIESVRNEKYMQGDYVLAAENELNAHNQFLEYLSINGAIGGFVYAIAMAFLFLLSIERKDHLFTFVIFAFILANFTESMMVRIKGIEYFAIFMSLFLCSRKNFMKTHTNSKQSFENQRNG